MDISKIRLSLLLLFVTIVLIACGPAHETTQAKIPNAKANSPLKLNLQIQGRLKYDDVNDFIVSVSSASGFNEVEYRILPNKDLVLCQGQMHWRGPIEAKQSKTFSFSCFLPKSAHFPIEAEVLTRSTNNSKYAASAKIDLGGSLHKGLSAADYVNIRKEQGRSIREYYIK